MKVLRMVGLAVVAILMCVNFSSCKDDDDETSNNVLVGTTWKEQNDIEWWIWEFRSNSEMVWTYDDKDGDDKDVEKYKYTYNESNGALSIETSYLESGVASFNISITGNTMIVTEDDGNKLTFKKQ